MKTVQYFDEDYLEKCRKFSVNEILIFLENFQNLTHGTQKKKNKLISIKIEPALLECFRKKANLENYPYQTKIKELMKKYCLSEI